jgi:peroxin-16
MNTRPTTPPSSSSSGSGSGIVVVEKLNEIVEKYQNFVLTHFDMIQYGEALVRTVLFMTPGRYRDSELKVETAYAGLGFMSLVHDYIILKFLKHQEQTKKLRIPGLPPSECIPVAKWLSFFQFTELVIEIASKQKWGQRGKWTAVFIIEVIKAFLKFRLLRALKGHTIVYSLIPAFRNADYIKQLINQHQAESKKNKVPKREKRLVSSEKWEQFKLQLRSEQKVYPYAAPLGETFAETLFILRPIIYLITMYRYGRQSWKSWLSSLFVDIFSLAYYSRRKEPLIDVQRDEISRRASLLFYYLLRSPFFELITDKNPRPIRAIIRKLASVPLLKSAFESRYTNRKS